MRFSHLALLVSLTTPQASAFPTRCLVCLYTSRIILQRFAAFPTMSGCNEQARQDALYERNEERKILGEMLDEPGRGGLSNERAVALQEVFKRRYPSSMPKSDRGLAADKGARLEGLAEMAMTRVKRSLIEEVEEEEAEEKGPISDGITMSYSLNGKPCTKEEQDEGDIPRRIIKERNEQRLAKSAPAPATSFLAQIQREC